MLQVMTRAAIALDIENMHVCHLINVMLTSAHDTNIHIGL